MVSLTLYVNGNLGNMTGVQLNQMMKQAYMEAAIEGPGIRRLNARLTNRTL